MNQHHVTYRGPQVCALAGITYRQLDYWCRVGLLRPERPARGSGSQRGFSTRETQVAWVLGQLSRLGPGLLCELEELRTVEHFTGWVVVHPDGCTVVQEADELADYPVAATIDLAGCPIGTSPPAAVSA